MHGIELVVARERFIDLIDTITVRIQHHDMDVATLLLSPDQVVV